MLTQELDDIRARVQSGSLANEASVSQAVVLPLLRALGWPIYDTQVVSPEYALEGQRVDYALSHPAAKPRVFIEVKQVGRSDGAERQLFEYAFHRGVPLVVLTDGQEWNFFLPAEAGDYGERRVYKLDLVEREIAESAQRLERYLKYESVCSGKALTDARADYQDVARARQTQDALPDAWSRLVEEEDTSLIELLADRVGSLCGYKPDPDSVARFLRDGLALRGAAITTAQPVRRPQLVSTNDRPTTSAASSLQTFGFEFLGQKARCRSGREVLIAAIEAIANHDQTFLERFTALPRHGRTRRYIALDRADLYPGRADLAEECSHRLKSGYWLGTNLSLRQIEQIIKMACRVARLKYGSELKVQLG